MLRSVAQEFPPSRRRKEYGYSLHLDAGDAETFDRIIDGAPQGTKITRVYIRSVIQAEARAHMRELEKERERRAHNLEIARREKEEARLAALKATSKREREEAQQRQEAAAQKEQANRVPPKKSDVPKPPVSDQSVMRAALMFEQDAIKVRRLLKAMTVNIAPLVSALDKVWIDAEVEELLTIAEDARKLADLIRGVQTDKRSHLSVVA